MKWNRRLTFFLLFGLGLFFSLNRHSRAGLFNYHSELWADKSGYNVYLPAAFLYGFEARRFPAGIDSLTGTGFRLDLATNKVVTKYPYGVALLQAPFWLVAHALNPDANGYSKAEQKSVNLAAVTYFTLGLLLLYGALRRYFSAGISALTLLALTLGTNLGYYAYYETGMSHCYSFFAVAWLLSLVMRPCSGPISALNPVPWTAPGVPLGRLAGIGAALALITILRPLDGLLALLLLLWPATPASSWRAAANGLLRVRFGLVLGLALALAWLPQLFYYRYLHHTWLVYSYGQEGFPYLARPRLAEIWLAPNNGSLLYNPLLLALGPGAWLLSRWAGWWAALAVGSWLLFSYLYASWWAYALGCGYAGRGFVELYPMLAWPLAALLAAGQQWRPLGRWALVALVGLLIGYNINLLWHFDRCFYGAHDWDWAAYRHLWS